MITCLALLIFGTGCALTSTLISIMDELHREPEEADAE